MPTRTLGQFFLVATARQPRRAFVRRSRGTISHSQMAVSVASTVQRLQAMGIRRGDHVACYLEDQLPNLTFELACALTGVVGVPLSPLFSPDYLFEGVVRPVNAKAILTTPAWKPALAGRGVPLLAYPDDGHPDLEGFEALADLPLSLDEAMETLERSSHGVREEDVFVIQPTSGSTGTPKLVVRRHRAFTRYADFVGHELLQGDGDPSSFLMAATLTHAFGLHMLTTAVKLGATVCIPDALDTACALENVRALDPVVLPLLPRIQRSLVQQCDRDDPYGSRIFGPSARSLCSAGGCADPALLERIRRTGVEIIEFYGSSEASVVAITRRGAWRTGWSGALAPDVSAYLTKDGELAVRSPGVTPGYLGDPAATAATFDANGYYLTGDLAEVTPERQLRILGRKRDIFNTPEGSNIYPARIEEQLETLPPVEAAVLVGDQKPYLAALVVPRTPYAGPPNGAFLDPTAHADIYQRIGEQLATVNERLERVEQVVRFAVMSAPFAPDAYRAVGPGKIRRDRKAVDKLYAEVTQFLYAGTQLPEPSFVPGADRRLRPHQRKVQEVA